MDKRRCPNQAQQCHAEQPQMMEKRRSPLRAHNVKLNSHKCWRRGEAQKVPKGRNRAPGEGEEKDRNGPNQGGKEEKRKGYQKRAITGPTRDKRKKKMRPNWVGEKRRKEKERRRGPRIGPAAEENERREKKNKEKEVPK